MSSRTIYDAPAVRTFTLAVGSPDLNEEIGGGVEAVHIWVNNASNQPLYLPDAPDVVPPGVTRVVACQATGVARASWTIPSQYAPPQSSAAPKGAAILVFISEGVDISPTPGITTHLDLLDKAVINPAQVVTTVSAAGQATVAGIPDTSAYIVGALVALETQGASGPFQFSFVKAVTPNSLTLTANLIIALAPGDVIALVPSVNIFGGTRKRAWDVASGNNPGAGVKASVALAAINQKAYLLNFMFGAIVAIAANDGANLEYRFGGGGPQSATISEAALNSAGWQFNAPEQAVLGAIAESVTVQYQTAPQNAGNFQAVLIGVYLVIGEPA